MTPDQLAIHTFTNQPWSISECIENYARAGIRGISIWRETITGHDLKKVRTHLNDSGLTPVSLVRGGFFTGKNPQERKSAIEQNLTAIREAEALALPMIVLVCGATLSQSPDEILAQIEEGIRSILPAAEAANIRLAIEPLHPIYAADRSAVTSIRDANILAQSINHPLVGIAVDTFHVWWELNLATEIQTCAKNNHLFAFHICEFKSDFDHPLLDRGLPGIRKFQLLKEQGFFGKILSVRGEFGYWVFTGEHQGQPIQRPSWNYRAEDGGGMIVDMHCHWRYVIDTLFGYVTRVFCKAATHIPQRFDESGKPFPCTTDDSAYAIFETDTGITCQFNSSWNVRVRRDDLLTMQVDGTEGSAIVGLRKCWAQHQSVTPRPIWNPDIDSPINYYDN
jgi:sugar phosphate isomerase/epimerase